jgi:hypothetical protein
MRAQSRLDRYADVTREMIQHENDLINHRITWLCQIQGFLFAALALTQKSGSDAMLILLPIIGIAVAISSWTGLYAALVAIENLSGDMDKKCNEYRPRVMGLDTNKYLNENMNAENNAERCKIGNRLRGYINKNINIYFFFNKTDRSYLQNSESLGNNTVDNKRNKQNICKRNLILRFSQYAYPWIVLPWIFVIVWVYIIIFYHPLANNQLNPVNIILFLFSYT